MATRLSQILGIIQGVQSSAQSRLTDLHRQSQRTQQDGPYNGITRVYTPLDELGEIQPPRSSQVQTRAADLITEASTTLTRLFDVAATRDWANCAAHADITVGTHKIVEKVPVPYLLFLSKRLKDVHAFVEKMPVLDPAEAWEWDDAADCWATPPVRSVSTKKIPRNHVVAEAVIAPSGNIAPAQVKVYEEDVKVGEWSTRKFSGMLPATRRRELQERVESLQEAVQYAIAEANSMTVTDQHVGKKIFDYLLA